MRVEASHKKRNEDSVLFSLGEDMAQVKDTDDLLCVVGRNLKEVLGSVDISIEIFDKEKMTFKVLIADVCHEQKSHPDFNTIAFNEHTVNDGIHDAALGAIDPVVLNIQALQDNPQKHPGIRFIAAPGIKEIACIKLVNKNETVGFLTIFSKETNSFLLPALHLLRGISNHVSIALANILAYEEINKRDTEKFLLLAFSRDLATARDKTGLKTVIKQYLKSLFHINEYIITIKNDEDETYSYFLHDLTANSPEHDELEFLASTNMHVHESVTAVVSQSENPVIFNVGEMPMHCALAFAGAPFWKSVGAQKVIGKRLYVAEQDIGIIWQPGGYVNDHLLNGISAQIAIAIANVFSNEKIACQLTEINKYKKQLEDENLYLQQEIKAKNNHEEIIRLDTEMQKIITMVSQVAFTNTTVLILGETGTGKELIAHAIHNASPRKDKLMVKVNCASLPASLIESELFGHELGSFTGATERRIGKFELASNGTLFLDEIGEMPLELQVKLLRAIQEKEIERIGGKGTVKTDVRIIAATNRNLQKEVDDGRFRRDLYYRLNIFPITIPPLRERKKDIPLLASHFLNKHARANGKKINQFSAKVLQQLIAYDFPGNVRELEHLIERGIVITTGKILNEIHLPAKKLKKSLTDDYIKTLQENERDHILFVLEKCKGKIFGTGGAAQILGLPPSTLNSRLKKLGIKKVYEIGGAVAAQRT